MTESEVEELVLRRHIYQAKRVWDARGEVSAKFGKPTPNLILGAVAAPIPRAEGFHNGATSSTFQANRTILVGGYGYLSGQGYYPVVVKLSVAGASVVARSNDTGGSHA